MPSSIASKSNRSVSVNRSRDALNESDVLRLQREVDTFTRKLEQEKRRLFGVEEAYAAIQKEYRELAQKVDAMKPEAAIKKKNMGTKIKCLENQLEQFILKYNEVAAFNQGLRSEIDVIRRERVTLDKVKQTMAGEATKICKDSEDQEKKYASRSREAEKLKQKIMELKNWNDNENSIYLSEYEKLQRKFKEERDKNKIDTKDKNSKQKDKVENLLDTQAILKRRLQRIILNNKEKVKVIDQYMRNMKIIDEAFNIIKETSGITDIEEIMNSFIKSEEQNYSLFNYVNVLTQDIDFLEENNKDLTSEMELLERELDQKQKASEKTPEEEIEKQKIQEIICEKELYISDARNQLYKMRDPLEQALKKLVQTKFCSIPNLVIMDNFILNEQTIDYYLSIFEEMVNKLIPYISKVSNNANFMTSAMLLDEIDIKDFEKQKPVLSNNEFKDLLVADESALDMNRFMDETRLEELASFALEKHKEKSFFSATGTANMSAEKPGRESLNVSKI